MGQKGWLGHLVQQTYLQGLKEECACALQNLATCVSHNCEIKMDMVASINDNQPCPGCRITRAAIC